MQTPSRLQYNLSIQQQITPSTAITVGYVGSHAYHLALLVDPNTAIPKILSDGSPGCSLTPKQFFAPGRQCINPALGLLQEAYSTSDSTWEALKFYFHRRLTHHLLMNVSFPRSKHSPTNHVG